MVITQAQILAWLGHFVWPFMRAGGLALTAPIIGSNYVPARIKILFAAVLGMAVAMATPHLPAMPSTIGPVMWMSATNVFYGAMLGFVMWIAVSAITVAGEMMGLSMGLSFAKLSAPSTGTPMPVMSVIMIWAGLMAYLAAGGPIIMIATLSHSFAADPSGTIAVGGWHAIAMDGAMLFRDGLWLALPVVIAGLAINTILGVITSFAPSLNIFSVGFPLLYLGGIWVAMLTSGDIQNVFDAALRTSTQLLTHLI